MAGKAMSTDHGILGGTPVFSGTSVLIRILIEHLEVGGRRDDFLDSYPTVSSVDPRGLTSPHHS